MSYERSYLALDDAALLAQCDIHIYKSSGPGGQHRNKVSSAVRLRHHPTEVAAHGDDSRSQHENKRITLRRLRMNLACRVRNTPDSLELTPPPIVRECLFTPRGRKPPVKQRLEVGRRDVRFWYVAAYLLDVLNAREGKLSDAAAHIGISTGNLSRLLKSERHLFTAAQALRKQFGHKPLT